jgi:D-alanine-D-alanine ligase
LVDIEQSLLRLTPEQKSTLKVLFLARQAPLAVDAVAPGLDEKVGVEPRYNHELYTTLRELGINCTPCRSLDEFVAQATNFDYVFTIYNRSDFRNSEIFVSSHCEKMGIPYLGAPPNVRGLAEDKSFAKHLAKSIGLATSEWTTYGMHDELAAPNFAGPYFVKPRFGAASDEVSIESIQGDWPGLKSRIVDLLGKGKEAIVERCIDGTDLTVPVLGGVRPMVLPVMEEISDLPAGISTFRQKRQLDKGRVRRVFEDSELEKQIRASVQNLSSYVRPFDYIRADFHLDKKTREPVFLEFNIGCNLGSHAAIMQSAQHQGIDRHCVIEHLLAYSLWRQRRTTPGAMQ